MSNKILNTYAAYAFDDLIRKQSSSGAIFSLIAEKILSLSGIVYGVTMTDDCKGAEFVRVDNIEQLHLLRGSKYIQAKVCLILFKKSYVIKRWIIMQQLNIIHRK